MAGVLFIHWNQQSWKRTEVQIVSMSKLNISRLSTVIKSSLITTRGYVSYNKLDCEGKKSEAKKICFQGLCESLGLCVSYPAAH